MKLIEEYIKKEYNLAIASNELMQAFFKDVLNGDVPFFTEKNNTLYYGLSTDGLSIGKRR